MRKLLIPVTMILLLAFTFPVSADIAPPAKPPGANPQPGSEITQVRMVAETVTIDIQPDAPPDWLGAAKVTTDFTMRNLGAVKESMAVRFPIGTDDGWGNIPEIHSMTITVNGSAVEQRRIKGEDTSGYGSEVPWVEFDAEFPPQQDVKIRVSYRLEAAGEFPYIWFNYIFSTGAGWQGTIGSADLIVKFPYEPNNLNMITCRESTYNCTTAGGVISGKEIRWRFTDLEPTTEDNFQVYLATPSEWVKVLRLRDWVKTHPEDGESWGALGKLYKSLLFSPHGRRGFRDVFLKTDEGAQELYRLSLEGYSKAVEFKPEDAQWHAGYADLLAYYAVNAGYEGYNTLPEKIQALEEIHKALTIMPQDPLVKAIASEMNYIFSEGMTREGEEYDFPWLTTTPLPTATDIIPFTTTPETITGNPQSTPVPEKTGEMTSTETGNPKGTLPVCGGAALLPLILLFIVKRFH